MNAPLALNFVCKKRKGRPSQPNNPAISSIPSSLSAPLQLHLAAKALGCSARWLASASPIRLGDQRSRLAQAQGQQHRQLGQQPRRRERRWRPTAAWRRASPRCCAACLTTCRRQLWTMMWCSTWRQGWQRQTRTTLMSCGGLMGAGGGCASVGLPALRATCHSSAQPSAPAAGPLTRPFFPPFPF